MTVLIIHGIGGYAGIHWQKWLHDELIKKGYEVLMPEMPTPDHPNRKEWLETIKQLVLKIDLSELIIVGHSLGVVSALDFVEQSKKPIKALVSVSGFSNDYKAELNSYFLRERKIDFEKVNKNLKKSFVLYGDNDPYVPQKELRRLANNLNVGPIVFTGGGHLNTNSGFTKFSELLEIVENI